MVYMDNKTLLHKVCYVVKNLDNGALLAYTEQESAELSAETLRHNTGVKHQVLMCYLDKEVGLTDDNVISKHP